MKTLIILIIGLFLTCNLLAQKIDTTEFKDVKVDLHQPVNQLGQLRPLSSWEFTLSLVVLGFGVLVLGLEVILIWKRRIKEDNIVKFIVVTLIITSTLFLITAGYDNNQIAPAMGLLGTIAGYLLGKQDKDDKDEKKEDKKTDR